MTTNAMENEQSRIFIELYRYKPAWTALEESQRADYIAKVIANVGQLAGIGIRVIGYGRNDRSTSQRAAYDFFCVYLIPNADTQRAFESQIAKSGWYDFFDQVNVSGNATPFADLLSSHVKDVRR
jgi:hypothetical protein